jgi:hypothetical protein
LLVYQTDGTKGFYYYTASAWTILASGSSWALTGNAGTNSGTNYLGTTDNTSLKFKTNGAQSMLLDSLGNLGIGTAPAFTSGTFQEKLLVDAGTTSSYNAIVARGSINNYLQLNIQNQSNGTSASADIVATSDNGNESSNYIDMGINSSTNSQNIMGSANDAYLYTTGNNLLVGTGTPSKSLVFMTGGTTQTTNERMRIDGNGKVGIGTTSPATALHVFGTNPLTLTGVQTGTNTSADSVLTITGGLVRKLPASTFASSFTTGNLTETGSGILTITGGTNAVAGSGTSIQVKQANTTQNGFLSSTDWNTFNNKATAANTWSINGNSGTSSGTHFLGTTDNTSLKFKTNGTQSMILDSLGNVGIGTNNPTAVLHLKAGTAAASSAPLKLTAGTNMSTPEAGAVEFDGTNYFVTSSSVRYTLAKTLTATASLDFPSTSANTGSNLTISVTGAADGDVVLVGVPSSSAIANTCYTGYVSSANTVTVRFNNYTQGALNAAAGTFRVTIIKY